MLALDLWRFVVSDTNGMLIQALFGMARPSQLVAVVMVAATGCAMALARGHVLDLNALMMGLLALVLVAMSIHYSNEYADVATDRLTQRTPFSGGSGALVNTSLSPKIALIAAWLTLSGGLILMLVGVALTALSWVSLMVLLFGAFWGWMYSLPPLKLAWRGWGELDNAFLGSVVLLVYGDSLVGGVLSGIVALMGLPFFGLTFVNLLATTWPDRQADAQVGKATLATRWPPLRLRRLYLLAVTLALAALLVLAGRVIPVPIVLASSLALPFLTWGAWRYTRSEQPHATVYAMIALMLVQFFGWWLMALSGSSVSLS